MRSTTTVSGVVGRRLRAALVAVLLGLLSVLAVVGSPPTTAHADLLPRDEVTVGGYDYATDLAADVVARTSDDNLALRYRAGSVLRDGRIVLALPRREWPTPLHPAQKLFGLASDDGSVVVRPIAPFFEPGPGDCTVEPGQPSVVPAADEQLVVVDHVSCDAGQQLSVRLFGLTAPRTPGLHAVGVVVSGDGGTRLSEQLRVRVVKAPTTTLVVDAPSVVTVGEPFDVTISAVRPNGTLDTTFDGVVDVEDLGGPRCAPAALVPFTRLDRGRRTVTLSVAAPTSTRLLARDVRRRALPGLSAPYAQVVVPDDFAPSTCSTAYH